MTIDILNDYLVKGLVSKQSHPDLPLFIWNYSEKTQYGQLWDDVTIKCRGLITDYNGNIVVQPFEKFFNYEEVEGKNMIPWDSEYFYVQEKMDGSLGILFYYSGRWIMATRGSFTSDQSIRGLEILTKKYNLDKFNKDVVYLTEIIYPENRIVVQYDTEKISFLSCVLNYSSEDVNRDGDNELNWSTACAIFASSGIDQEDVVTTSHHQAFSNEFYRELKDRNTHNKEGFVLRFYPSNFRVKIKFEEYVRLHKIMTNISTKTVWECLMSGQNIEEMLVDVPDEFYAKIKSYVSELNYSHYNIYDYCGKIHDYFRYGKYNDVNPEPTKKEYAEYVMKNVDKNLHSVMFSIWDRKNVDQSIWKLLRPKYEKL